MRAPILISGAENSRTVSSAVRSAQDFVSRSRLTGGASENERTSSGKINEHIASLLGGIPHGFSKPALQTPLSLFDALAGYKIETSRISMHLDKDVRIRLFRQLDSMLDEEEWDPRDPPPSLASFRTFLRMMLRINPERRPGLGAGHAGNIVAAWTVGKNRLTVECQPNDKIRWVLSREVDGTVERAAGESSAGRLKDVLVPYLPKIWFSDAEQLP